MSKITLKSVGTVRSTRTEAVDDNWNNETAHIELNSEFDESAFKGLADFSHVEIIFYMDRVQSDKISYGARHPRGNDAWPSVGIFSQRGKDRPNQIGLTVCQITKVEGKRLFVKGLDAVDSTPVLDIKPWLKEFGPQGNTFQPKWASELMTSYWGANI